MLNAPFMNPTLQLVLYEGPFKGRTGLYKLFPEEFRDEPGEKEMPAVLVALAATFVRFHIIQRTPFSNVCLELYMALDAWVNGSGSVSWNYNSSAIAKVYRGHMDELKLIEAKKPTSYHAILCKFFSKCVYVFPAPSS